MSARGRELIAANESATLAKPLFDASVVEDSQDSRCFSNSTHTNQSDWDEVFCESNNLVDQFITSKDGPRRWRWRFPRYARYEYKTVDPSVFEIADLF